MKQCVITSAVRTAVGTYLGSLRTLRSIDLVVPLLLEAVRRSNLTPSQVDQVILGEVTGVGNLGRSALLKAGFPVTTPGYTVDRQCGSSLQAVVNAVQEINSGNGDIIISGGAESMSRMFYILPPECRYESFRAGSVKIYDMFEYITSVAVQPPELFPDLNMGITAENVAERYQISREEQDAFAYDSQMKTKRAQACGLFQEEILPLKFTVQNQPVVFDADEHPRPQTTPEALAKLRPVFRKDGTVTAGNSSGRNDGASAVVVMSAEKALALGCAPMVKIVSYAIAGVDPRVMGLGPAPAIQKAVRQAGLTLKDIGLFELNEAFAAQALGVLTELGMLPGTEMYQRINVNGGAIAHGHALGNSGTRILTTLIYEMKRQNVQYGLASLCIGGGQGIAMVIENC